MNYKISPAHAKYFWARIQHWMAYWGLTTQWSLQFRVEEAGEDEEEELGYFAAVIPQYEDGLATVLLAAHWPYKPTNPELDLCAYHETLHLMLAPLDPDLEAVSEQHRIIRILEKMVYSRL